MSVQCVHIHYETCIGMWCVFQSHRITYKSSQMYTHKIEALIYRKTSAKSLTKTLTVMVIKIGNGTGNWLCVRAVPSLSGLFMFICD